MYNLKDFIREELTLKKKQQTNKQTNKQLRGEDSLQKVPMKK